MCRKNTESKNPKVVKTKNERIMLLSKCTICDSKKSKFIKDPEASALISSLGIKTSLSKIPLVGFLLLEEYKMNKKINTFLLGEDKFMSDVHLGPWRFAYSACGPFTKSKERIQNF